MEPERWRRIKEVFSTALAVPPAMREAWLAETLPADPLLADEVRELVAVFEEGGAVFEVKTLATVPDVPGELATAVAGLRIGPYRILSELGRGGMGAVYLAVRADQAYEQRVAIKLVKRGMDTDDIVRRFVHERKILAALVHPNIARLIDGGSTIDGRPFFVMEYIEGRPITVFAQDKKLSVEDRLRLFVKVCSAVQFAHQNLIVHRDIKPGNLLVDRDGEPKLLDFGIAKLIAPPAFGNLSELTHAHRQPMTPDYASPEQLAGEPVTTATDIYGLGILLYELLVGQNPVGVAKLLGPGRAERLPSQAVRGLDGDRRRSRRLQGDLDTIVGKALEPEPQRRYATAAALAEDIERHLEQRPVKARPPTFGYRLGRTLVRQKLASALVLSVAIFAGIAGYEWNARAHEAARAEAQRLQAEEQRRKAQAFSGFLKGLFRSADPEHNRGEDIKIRQILDEGAKQLLNPGEHSPLWAPMPAGEVPLDPSTRASLLNDIAEIYADLGSYKEAENLLNNARAMRAGRTGRDDKLGEAASLTLLGHLALNQGDFSKCLPYYRQAIAIKEEQLGPADPALAEDLNGLGNALTENGDLKGAAESLSRAKFLSHRAGNSGLKELAVSLNNLAILSERQQRFGEAQEGYQAALNIDRTLLGADHPETLGLERNLGSILLRQKEYARAGDLYQEVLRAQERVLGTNHRDLILTLSSLGAAQNGQNRYPAAADSLRRALALHQSLGLPSDVEEAYALNIYAGVLRAQGDLAAAEAHYERSRQLYLQLEGDNRTSVASVLRGLSQVKLQRGDLPAAETLARQSLDLLHQAAGSNSEVAISLRKLSEIERKAGRVPEASEHERQALELEHPPSRPHS
ncbi:MAG TPA: serine/threonine-protein kinase [Thermoanaerobaculia bacterium]|jgi:serine/threonine-protein kinase|nr:serine/threonine-protein kinase [Thermoanaerobaculia bacterium]